jgi:quercetin dioxygenase-like cupin family protein
MNSHSRSVVFIALGLAASCAFSLAQKAAQSVRFPQFDNADVKVWRTIIQPKQPLALHRHDHGRVLTALTPGTLNIVESSGETEILHLEPGKAYWLPAMAPGAMHSDVNGGDQPIEVMVVELQKNVYTAK